MSADAVTKVAESLSELGLPSGQRERLSHIVLNAIDYDALKAERDRAKEAVRNLDKALRNAVKERGDALDDRDRLREPIDLTVVYETIDCDWPVPRCLGVAGWLRWHDEHGWLSVCGRHARAALDSDPDLAERTRRIRADE